MKQIVFSIHNKISFILKKNGKFYGGAVFRTLINNFFIKNNLSEAEKSLNNRLVGPFKQILKLSAVRKVLETLLFIALGSFRAIDPKLSHGTSSKFVDVRTHLRRVSKVTLSVI